MKKIIKILIPRTHFPETGGGERTNLHWPDGWMSEKANVVAYGTEEINRAGNRSAIEAIAVVEEKDLLHFLALGNVQEISEQEADRKGAQWRPQVPKIEDEKKVMAAIDAITQDPGIRRHIPAQYLAVLDKRETDAGGVILSDKFSIKKHM